MLKSTTAALEAVRGREEVDPSSTPKASSWAVSRPSSPCACVASTCRPTPRTSTCGDYVVVTNVDKVVFTGKKLTDKVYYRHTGHPGGVKSTTPQKVLNGRFPERVLEKAVERMLPKESPLARRQMTHLRLFAGSAHTHEAQQPETIDFAGRSAKNTRSI